MVKEGRRIVKLLEVKRSLSYEGLSHIMQVRVLRID